MKCPTNANGVVTKIGTSSVGTDLKPIKLVNGVPTAVTNDLVSTTGAQTIAGTKTFYSTGFTEIAIKTTRTDATQNIGGLHFINGNNDAGPYITGTVNGRVLFDITNSTVKAVQILQQRAYNASNIYDIATIETLDNYTPMVRTTGNQTIAGIKTFTSPIVLAGGHDNSYYNINNSRLSNHTSNQSEGVFIVADGNDNVRAGFTFKSYSDGKTELILNLRNSDDSTFKSISLGISD